MSKGTVHTVHQINVCTGMVFRHVHLIPIVFLTLVLRDFRIIILKFHKTDFSANVIVLISKAWILRIRFVKKKPNNNYYPSI